MKKLAYLITSLVFLINLNCSSIDKRFHKEFELEQPNRAKLQSIIPKEISIDKRLENLGYEKINYIDLILALKSGITQPDQIESFDTKQYEELRKLSEQEIIKYLKPVASRENPYDYINVREAAKDLVELLGLKDPAKREIMDGD